MRGGEVSGGATTDGAATDGAAGAGGPRLPAAGETPVPVHAGEYVSLGEQQLFVRRAPEPAHPGPAAREPAVAVHGLGGSSTNWTDLAHLLADRLDLLAPDLPGFGRSEPPPGGDYRLDAHADAVAALAEHEGRGPVHLFGNSMGGAVAVTLAVRRPDLVRSLVLVSPALPGGRLRALSPLFRGPLGPLATTLATQLLPGVGARARADLAALTPAERVRRTLELCWSDPAAVAPARRREAEQEVARRDTLAWTEAAFSGSLRGLVDAGLRGGQHDVWRGLASLDVPVLIVWGREDRLVPASLAERVRPLLREGRVEVLEGVGHVAQAEVPDLVADLVRDHLARRSGAAA